MSHFKNVKINKDKLKFVDDFEYIINNAFCTYSFNKAYNRWIEMKHTIPDPYEFKIGIEMNHIYCGHGIWQAREELKDQIVKFLES